MQHHMTTPHRPWSHQGRRRHRIVAGLIVVGATLICIPLVTQAQTANRFLLDQYFPQGIPGYGQEPGVTVLSRARPLYDPLGVRAGDFIIRPELDSGIGYNSNLLGQSSGRGSYQFENSGSVRVNSDWGRNSLAGEVTFDDRRTPSVSSENRTDWSATLGGTYQIGRDVLTVAGSHLQLHQDPTGIDAQRFNLPGSFFTAPIPFTLDDARVSYETAFGRFAVVPNLEYSRLRFGDLRLFGVNGAVVPAEVNGTVLGVPISQQYRDRDILTAGVTTRYEFAPLRSGLLVVRHITTDYTSSQRDAFGANRSSNAVEVLVGLDYVASAVWRYRALAGYEIRQFRNSAYKSHGAPVAEANVIWQPSGRTTVTARVARSIEDAADESVSGYDYTTARLQADHEYLRNILLSGYVGLQRADYLQSNNSETFYGGGAGVTWLVNRNIRLAVTYDATQRSGSKGFGSDYLTNVGLLTLKLGL
jgi:hypothetical protein